MMARPSRAGTPHHQRPFQRDGPGQRRRQTRFRPRRPGGIRRVADGSPRAAVREFRGTRTTAANRKRRVEGQERVTDRGHVLDDRQRDRDEVGERSQVEQEVGIQRRRQDEWRADVTSAGVIPAISRLVI